MKEFAKTIKARVSMVWHALTARNCVVSWVDDGGQYSAYIVYDNEWPSGYDISTEE